MTEAPQRAVFLARTARGWAELCRLVSVASDRGVTWGDLSCPDDELFVLLGADSEVGQALASGRPDRAAVLLGPWRERFGRSLRIEASWHGRPGTGPGSLRLAARMAGFAAEQQLVPVLSNAVRYADPGRGEVADILDSARLLVPIDARDASRLDSGQRWLKDAGEMERIAGRIAEAVGGRGGDARRLLAATEETAEACAVDPGDAFGLGRLNLPEPELVGASAESADRVLADRCAAGMLSRAYHREGERWDRLENELRIIAGHGFAGYFLTVAEVAAQARRLGVRVAARGSGVGSLVTHLLGISPVDPVAHGLVMERFLSEHRSALPDIDLDVESARRLEIYQAVRERFGGDRVATLAVYKTYRARGAIEVVARAAAWHRTRRPGSARHSRTSGPRTCGPRSPSCRSCARSPRRTTAGSGSWWRRSTSCRSRRRCTRAGCSSPTRRWYGAPRWRRPPSRTSPCPSSTRRTSRTPDTRRSTSSAYGCSRRSRTRPPRSNASPANPSTWTIPHRCRRTTPPRTT